MNLQGSTISVPGQHEAPAVHYRLTGVVSYIMAGNTPHYIAFVRSTKDTKQWFATDDSQVRTILVLLVLY